MSFYNIYTRHMSNNNNDIVDNNYNSNMNYNNGTFNQPINYNPIPIFDIFGNKPIETSDINPEEIIKPNEDGNVPTMVNDENSYINSYKPFLNELNALNLDAKRNYSALEDDIMKVRNSNGKNKYENLAKLLPAQSSLISSRLNIIKEASSIINNSHNLDLKRFKDISKLTDNNKDEDSDNIINNLFSMMVNSPNDLDILPAQKLYQNGMGINSNDDGEIMKMYEEYVNDVNMLNSEIIVVFNEADNQLRFAAVDENGNYINSPNIPDTHHTKNIVIDKINMLAKDSKLGFSYRLVLENHAVNDEEFYEDEF